MKLLVATFLVLFASCAWAQDDFVEYGDTQASDFDGVRVARSLQGAGGRRGNYNHGQARPSEDPKISPSSIELANAEHYSTGFGGPVIR